MITFAESCTFEFVDPNHHDFPRPRKLRVADRIRKRHCDVEIALFVARVIDVRRQNEVGDFDEKSTGVLHLHFETAPK